MFNAITYLDIGSRGVLVLNWDERVSIFVESMVLAETLPRLLDDVLYVRHDLPAIGVRLFHIKLSWTPVSR